MSEKIIPPVGMFNPVGQVDNEKRKEAFLQAQALEQKRQEQKTLRGVGHP